jgi:membrane-bound serine protease (ClpP class)
MTQLLGVFFLAIVATVFSPATAASAPVFIVPLSGAIGPASADFVGRALARAEKEGAQLVVLRIDTPGGLDLSMRQIIKDILASPVPVAAFVAPSGARAASAGTYILYASHIAAMAQGTNLGAATPVNIAVPSPLGPSPAPKPTIADDKGKGEKGKGDGGKGDKGKGETGATSDKTEGSTDTLTRKQLSDAAAYIRAFAQMRGRNAEWAERAVREGVSLSAEEALAQKVIDLTARDVPELLAKLDGRKVTTAGGERTLATAGAALVTVETDWRTQFLAIITEPSVALILLMIGVYGLFFEFWNPGLALPGVVGAVCLLIGLSRCKCCRSTTPAWRSSCSVCCSWSPSCSFPPSVLSAQAASSPAIGAVMLIDTGCRASGVPLGLMRHWPPSAHCLWALSLRSRFRRGDVRS